MYCVLYFPEVIKALPNVCLALKYAVHIQGCQENLQHFHSADLVHTVSYAVEKCCYNGVLSQPLESSAVGQCQLCDSE